MVFFPSLLFLFQGTSNHEIQYTYEDHTEARKEEARQRELRRLENDQRQKEFQEKLRQRAEEAERKVGQEKERRRAEYQKQRATRNRARGGQDKDSAPDSSTGQEGTTLQDYLPEMFFHLVDTRGFFNYNHV